MLFNYLWNPLFGYDLPCVKYFYFINFSFYH